MNRAAHSLLPALLLLLALAACTGDDPAKTAQRTAAHRAACVAEELAIQANSKVSSLDTLRANAAGSVVEQIYPFARAYFDYARARDRQTALVDSAAAAESSEDSVRFAGLAATAAPSRPNGNLQVNAAESYERDHARLLSNPDHPCNQAAGER